MQCYHILIVFVFLGPMVWIMKQISQDINPRNVISQIMPGVAIPRVVDPMTLWKVVWEILTEPKPRQKLDQVSTLDDVVGLIARSKNIIVLTGAGVSNKSSSNTEIENFNKLSKVSVKEESIFNIRFRSFHKNIFQTIFLIDDFIFLTYAKDVHVPV